MKIINKITKYKQNISYLLFLVLVILKIIDFIITFVELTYFNGVEIGLLGFNYFSIGLMFFLFIGLFIMIREKLSIGFTNIMLMLLIGYYLYVFIFNYNQIILRV